jgi:hypothetical protein
MDMSDPIPKDFKPQARLMIQGSIPVEDLVHGEQLYIMLKEIFLTSSPKSSIAGQISMQLEPCCKDRQKGS